LAAVLGLGIDESYMVVAGRGAFRLGYFDHPPIAWWLSHGAALLGGESAFVVRLPFVALFAGSTWLMFRLADEVASARAGLWAAVAFNLAPVFGVTSGGWVLPDGPLVCALLGMALCAVRALQAPGWRWWLGCGACAGLALMSKYTAVLDIAGLALFLLSTAERRRWLGRPQPWVAALVALLVFSPVLAWNAGNGFASLAFQGGRAAAARFQPLGPIMTLAGEALFLLPWIWAGLMLVLWRGFRAGSLLAWMAWPAILLFAVVSLWSRQVLFHWAAPGYLMLFPLLGAWLVDRRWIPRAARWSGGFVVAALLLVVAETRLGLVPGDPLAQLRDWTSLGDGLAARGLPIAAANWSDAGKIGVGLGPEIPIFCLSADPREFRFATTPPTGGDVLIVAPRLSLAQMQTAYGGRFAAIEALAPVMTQEAGAIPVYLGRGLIRWP
jgi:4-amino-4-deoxy-L-arabinose transferase-like glycosyltransferase